LYWLPLYQNLGVREQSLKKTQGLRENRVTEQANLSGLCDKIVEAGWMAIAVIVPLFFNVYSHRSFEPDKIALMRSITLMMGLAWAIKELEARTWKLEVGGCRLVLKAPLVLPALLLSVAYIFATITSIAPRLSLWGSYHRMQGAYTTLSYIAIFFLILRTLHHRKQLRHLITVILFTSLPISLYGIMQHYGLDPIAWTNVSYRITDRAISTMGNPIFLAAYLIMIAPLTLGRLMQLASVIRGGKRSISLYVLSGCYAFLLAIQSLCILFTQSRGPLLGLMGGVFFFFLLLASSRGNKRFAAVVLGIAIIFGFLLIALSLPNPAFESIRETLRLGRLSGVLNLESRTAQQRTLAWEGAVSLITADSKRALIGYGPETMIAALNPHLPPDLASLKPDEAFDRSHNETLDILATTGFVGLAAYLFLFSSLLYYGLKYLDLIKSSRHRRQFILLCLVGGLAGGLLPWLLERRWRFAGVGVPFGILAALGVYLLIHVFLHHQGEEVKRRQSPVLLIALLSAVIAHFIEIQIGISVVATHTYFWIYAALIIVAGFYLQGETSPDKRPSKRWGSSTRDASLLSSSLLVGLILATMSFSLFGGQVDSLGEVCAVLGFLFTVWLTCITMAIIEAREGIASLADGIRSIPFLISLGWFVAFLIVYIFVMQIDGVNALTFYYLYLFLVIIVIAVILFRAMTASIRFQPRIHWWPYPLLITVVLVVVITTNVNPVRADIHYKQGLAYANNRQWDKSIVLFRRALELAPGQDFYYLFLAGAYVEKARVASDITQRSTWLEEAQRALERGKEINPLNPDHVSKLGLLYRTWGEMLTEQQEKAERFDQALEYYRQAEALRPHDPKIFNEWGLAHFAKGEYDQAIAKYQRSLNLNSESIQTHLLLGDAYRANGNFARAVEVYERITDIAPDDFKGHRNLALLYEQMGRTEDAIAEAETAKSLAPDNEIVVLEELIIRLQAQKR
jgi:Flp pilus assembly protein TadD/O-antigen ligase